jgi:hypothetical protein
MTTKQLIRELEKNIEPKLVKELIHEFQETKSAYWLGDEIKTLNHAAKFSEVCIACLMNLADPKETVDINNIEFGKFYDKIIKLPKQTSKEELLFLVIPNALKSVYNIRNKKRVVHVKLNNVDKIDSELAITTCNWVLSQFIFLFLSKDVERAISLTNSLMEKKIPVIENFEDGQIMILKRDLKFGEELLLILYQFQKRLSTKELNHILKPKKPSYITTYLNILYDKKLIHLNENGAIINKNGIKEVESNRKKYFN